MADTYIHGCMYNASQKFDLKTPSAVNFHNDVPFYCKLPRCLARNLCCRERGGGAALGLTGWSATVLRPARQSSSPYCRATLSSMPENMKTEQQERRMHPASTFRKLFSARNIAAALMVAGIVLISLF